MTSGGGGGMELRAFREMWDCEDMDGLTVKEDCERRQLLSSSSKQAVKKDVSDSWNVVEVAKEE
jgi:hypothetical protein